LRSAGTTACSRRTGIGLTGSRCWLLLRRALRLGLGLLNLRLLSYAIRGDGSWSTGTSETPSKSG
jgi:hypothetical protein